jgi:ABC-2 type transport system permease protein
MSWGKIRTIIAKEWADTFRNRLVFFTMIFLPLVLTAMPLVEMYFVGQAPASEIDPSDLGPFTAYQTYFRLDPQETVMAGMASIFMIIFLMMPLILPMMIATDSIVSEKVGKSLEPLLAAPVSVTELLVGKALAAVGPAVLVTWVCYGLYAAVASLFASPGVLRVILSPDWILGILLLTPLMALFAVSAGIVVSSRVNDTRTAQQISGFLVLPLMLVFIPMFLGRLVLNALAFLVGAALFLVLDVAAIILATALFQRETILTRWK